jgi:hypothetical protein
VHDSSGILQYFIVPEPQQFEIIALQIGVTLCIDSAALLKIVLPSINLDYESRRKAGKIYDQMVYRDLSPEVETISLQRTKLVLQPSFCDGLIAA